MELGKKKGAKKSELPKILDDNNGKNKAKLMVNKGYQLYYIVTSFVKKGLWFGSCMTLMFLFPMVIEYMGEQNKILMKIQMQMASTGGGMDMGASGQRPF